MSDYDIDADGKMTAVPVVITDADPSFSAEVARVRGLSKNGYSVVMLSGYHFRINGCIDLFPRGKRYHDLVTQKRGNYADALVAVRTLLK